MDLTCRARSRRAAPWSPRKGQQCARVLVLEVRAIIAIDIDNILTKAGLSVAKTLGSWTDFLKCLDANDDEVTLLDMHLLDGSCEPVARRLAEKGIPFLIFSGGLDANETIDPY